MIAPEINELLAILMDTPGLKHEQIGPLLKKWQSSDIKNMAFADDATIGFYWTICDMLEAWEG